MQLEFFNLSKTRRLRTSCQPTQSTSGPVLGSAEHTPSQGGRCPSRAALGQPCQGIGSSRLGAAAWLVCCSYLSRHQDNPVSGTWLALDLGFPDGSVGKESTCSAEDAEDVGLIPRSGRSPGGGNGNPLQCSCLENPRMGEPGGLQFMGSQRIGHDLATKKQKHIFSGQKIENKVK